MEKVLERLSMTESTTLAPKREDGGKIRVTSLLWAAPKVILRGEAPEIRNVDGRLHIAQGLGSTSPTRPVALSYPRQYARASKILMARCRSSANLQNN
jgi:hypothetical protein